MVGCGIFSTELSLILLLFTSPISGCYGHFFLFRAFVPPTYRLSHAGSSASQLLCTLQKAGATLHGNYAEEAQNTTDSRSLFFSPTIIITPHPIASISPRCIALLCYSRYSSLSALEFLHDVAERPVERQSARAVPDERQIASSGASSEPLKPQVTSPGVYKTQVEQPVKHPLASA